MCCFCNSLSCLQFFPFCGENQIIGSAKNGNYLGSLELLSEFEHFLEELLNCMEILEKGTNRNYQQTCEEFIELMDYMFFALFLKN